MKDKFEERLKGKYEQLRLKEEQAQLDNLNASSLNSLKRKISTSQLPEKTGGFKRSSAYEAKAREASSDQLTTSKPPTSSDSTTTTATTAASTTSLLAPQQEQQQQHHEAEMV